MQKNTKVLIEQERLNRRLAQFFMERGVEKVRLTSLGNSIASGYSMVRTIKPLLLRNETIEDTMRESGINLERHHFARAQNNNDERVFEWLENNTKESEIHKLNRNDYSNSQTRMPTHGITKEEIEEYYPVDMINDIGLKDAILESNKNLANIVIYNGATGSFLDANTRNGKISQRLMNSVNRDTYSIEAILKTIHFNNRQNDGNTQVYICGAPNFLGLRISELINHKLKKLASKYANVIYVEPVKSKLFYKELDAYEYDDLGKLQRMFRKSLGTFDVHYDEEEYQELNNNILRSINENYQVVDSIINIDRKFYKLSSHIEIDNQELLNNKEARRQMILKELEKECDKMDSSVKKRSFLTRVNKYLIERFAYDFCYLGKEDINESVEEIDRRYQ